MKSQLIILLMVSLFIIALDPQWMFFIACLVLAILLIPIGGDNE